jgi:hypothetical protein
MHVKPRSYLTAGIAALGVGAIALSPIQPIPSQAALAPQRVVSNLGVDLAAAVDPITAWVDTFETTFANIGILGEFYMQKPFPLLQTIAANTATYAEETANGQGDLIGEQIWNNIVTFFEAPWSPGVTATLGPPPPGSGEGEAEVPAGTYLSKTQPKPPPQNPDSFPLTPSIFNTTLLQFAAGWSVGFPEDPEAWSQVVSLSPIWRFLNTPYSGQVLGLLGPVISPVVELVKSFTAVGEAFEGGNVQDALFELINIPANMTNAFFNGTGFWDLTGVIENFFTLPEAFEGTKIGFNMGGLLNAVPVDGSLVDPANPPTKYASGVAFDSLAIPECTGSGTACAFINDQPIPGLPNGWLGSAIGLGQFLGDQLLVTPPAPPPVAAQPAAAKEAAPLDIPAPAVTEAPAEESAPAVVDIPAEEAAPAVAEVVAEDPAPVVEDTAEVEAAIEAVAEIEAAIEVVEASAAEPAEAATPAAEDSGPEAAAADSDKSDDDTDRSGSKNRRGAS